MISNSHFAAISSRQHENDVLPSAEGFEQTSMKENKRMAEGEALNGDALEGAARNISTPNEKGMKLIMDFTRWCMFTDLSQEELDAIDPHIYCISADEDECNPADWMCFIVYYRDDEMCAKTSLRKDGLILCVTYDREGEGLMTSWNVYKPVPLCSKGCEPYDSISELHASWETLRKHLDSAFPLEMIDFPKPVYTA